MESIGTSWLRLALAACLTPLCLGSTPAFASIVGVLEEPVAQGDCAGIGNVRGWAYSDTGAALVQPFTVTVDGGAGIEVPCCSSRGDVQASQPGAPSRTGFSGSYNFQLLEPGEHTFSVAITSATGETTQISSTCTSHRFDAATFLSAVDFDNDAEGFCESDLDDPNLICCFGVRITRRSDSQQFICDDACFHWQNAAQGLTLASGALFDDPLCTPVLP